MAATKLPEVGVPRSTPSVELYRSVSGSYSWRILAVAVDDSSDALRAAKALALELEDEMYSDMLARREQRRRPA